MKQQLYQQFVYKIHSSEILRIKGRRKNLVITPSKARLNDEVISLADSNVLRSIDELNGVNREEIAKQVETIRSRIIYLRNSNNGNSKAANRKELKKLYSRLDEIQFKSDYVMIVMDKTSDFDKLNKGFEINGIGFKRLVGTTNGVKQSTVVYCSVVNEKGVHIYEELEKRLNGGRDESKELIPAKYEAYKSLACSASVPVSMPKDILVVDDFVLNVKAKYIRLEDSETSNEPIETYVDGEVELNASDGFGMMLPSLAERWSSELELDYTAGGMCIRNLFCKGMVYTFDFKEFAKRYYESDTITDVWGTVHNIDDVELILPVSVMKLWDSYSSLAHYLKCCEEFHHTFAVTKTCEKDLENERTLNYQFIQSYELSDDEIRELIMPTLNELKETICGDPDKTLLFLRGACGEKYKFDRDDNYLAKAIMINPEIANDPYIIGVVGNMLSTKIKQAKIGVVKIHGNYTVISGDPFAFCQSIFKCDVPDENKGLLKAGEIYSKYWIDDSNGEGKRVVCFRAPMSCHANIRAMNVVHNEDIDFWYQYMSTVNIINVHDMFYPACNGADNDGDAIFTTDNYILLSKWRNEPAILCVQKKGQKCIITLNCLAESNKNGFGDAIGAITNRITAMYDIMSRFPPGSEQHKILEYRIRCGQQYQQGAIDKIKGIVTKPMPQEWYNIHSVIVADDDNEKTVERKNKNREIVADKKPYFMIYIYPRLYKELKKYNDAAKIKSELLFGIPLEELLSKSDRTEDEEECVKWYWKLYPVFNNNSVMNRICHIVENEFEGYVSSARKKNDSVFYKEIMSSNNELKIQVSERKQLVNLYKEYVKNMKSISVIANVERCSPEELYTKKAALLIEFERQCSIVCPNTEQLCNALLDICYSNDNSKKFVWDMCGKQIIKNLLKKYGSYTYFTLDNSGDVTYCGKTYKRNLIRGAETESDILDKNNNE